MHSDQDDSFEPLLGYVILEQAQAAVDLDIVWFQLNTLI